MNISVITEGDDDGLNDSDVEEEPELPIGVSIKGLRKVFKVSNYDIYLILLPLGKTQSMGHDTPWGQGCFHSSHNPAG